MADRTFLLPALAACLVACGSETASPGGSDPGPGGGTAVFAGAGGAGAGAGGAGGAGAGGAGGAGLQADGGGLAGGGADAGQPVMDAGGNEPPPMPVTGGNGRDRQIVPPGTTLYGPHGAAINARNAASGSEATLLGKIADQPVARWFGGWSGNIQSAVQGFTTEARGAGGVPVLVAYNIPGRDCGNYSAGGAGSADAYRTWIDGFAAGIGDRPALVILEPDAVPLNDCLSAAAKQERNDLLAYAVQALSAQPAVAVYIDGGHSAWLSSSELANRLMAAGVAGARGFALNTSNFRTTAESISYGDQVASALGGAHYVVDTGRNGLGPWNGGSESWCNPPGRALGEAPTTDSGHAQVDALLWVKPPGESDGTCQGGPPAGQFWKEYALGLADRAAW